MAEGKNYEFDAKQKNSGKSNKAVAIAVVVVIVFLLFACIRMQMELNELRKEYEEKTVQNNELRLKIEELEYLIDLKENDPEGYKDYMAKEMGYYDPSSTVYSNGTTSGN